MTSGPSRVTRGLCVCWLAGAPGIVWTSGRADAQGRYRLDGLDYEYRVTMSAPCHVGGVVGAGGLLCPEDGWGVVSCPAGGLSPARMVGK